MTRTREPGNPDPTPRNNPSEYTQHECPFCGEPTKRLPEHLRHKCPAQ